MYQIKIFAFDTEKDWRSNSSDKINLNSRKGFFLAGIALQVLLQFDKKDVNQSRQTVLAPLGELSDIYLKKHSLKI